MVIAKTDRAHRHLAGQFHDRTVVKEYEALVWGTPRAGEAMDRPIGRDPERRMKMSSRGRPSRSATTTVAGVEPLDGVSFIHVRIGTGRTHQIRVHLSEAGHPVAGDALYGGVRRRLPPSLAAIGRLSRPFLHASLIGFAHPTSGRAMEFRAALPGDLDDVLSALRRARAGRRT
jgi:23S rRNA pseudouridine1911/1915/1917 synthase